MPEQANICDTTTYWKQKYDELHVEYLRLCEDNQALNAKLEKHEARAAYNDDLESRCRHFEMMFNDAERNRQILAAQMDVVYLIFGKTN